MSEEVVSKERVQSAIDLVTKVISSWPEEKYVPKDVVIETLQLEFRNLLRAEEIEK